MSISKRITITHLVNILKNAGKTKHIPLGRWKVCLNKNTGLIADYSNEDHCGTCNSIVRGKSLENPEEGKEMNLLEMDYAYLIINSPG